MVFKRKYSWADGFNFATPAETVGEVIEAIETDKGRVTRELFLDASRPEEAPTHQMFEWDDEVAAEKYRLSQAGKIICGLKIQVVSDNEPPKKVSAVINVESKQAASYIGIEAALSKPDTRAIVLDHAKRELKAFEQKYSILEELADVFAAIDALDA